VNDPAPRRRAQQRAEHVLASLQELHEADWYDADWLPTNLQRVASEFDRTCERWRDLYRAALEQAANQDRIIRDASRSSGDKRQAERLRREAEEQLKLLTDSRTISQSDFYSYRYFASEGFLPGYSFPRLPLSAYIQARRRQQRDDFLSRPRFLAISEFGPRAIVYHEGSRYIINRVILPVGGDSENPLTRQAKLCPACGYLHPTQDDNGPDTCERCHTKLDTALPNLFRLQNVSTKRRDRISSDEEERMRMGYELLTGVRFREQGGDPVYRTAKIKEADNTELARLFYGQAATLWRINLGWMRRSNPNDYGFTLDMERGYWGKRQQQDDEPEDPMSPRTMKVIPYVEDRRNCLLVEPAAGLLGELAGAVLDMATLVSVQAALKHAIQVIYQLEDNELAVELLPNRNEPRLLLFYESAEGGAGVLRRLVDDPQAFAEIAREALRICHFDPHSGEDKKRAPRANEDCEAACYDCLMTYANQRDHHTLDRHLARDLLLRFSQAHLSAAPVAETRTTHLGRLLHQAESELERQWLRMLDERSYRLPSHAQYRVPECGTRPDFYYEQGAAIYIDGPHHDYPDRQARDVAQAACMEDEYGIVVIRFGHQDDWQQIIARYPSIFGSGV
jgi:very-short-patch-repair endonuclease